MKRLLCLMMSIMIGVLSASITAFAYDSSIDFVQELDEIELYDRKLNRNVKIGIIKTQQTRIENELIDTYKVFTDGILDYTLQVDLNNDRAYLKYRDGHTEEIVISESVVVEKIPDNTNPVIDEPKSNGTKAAANYIGNEPFEISSSGAQRTLGTTMYSGYEAMGSLSYYNPAETGFLQRKNSGYTTFDSYRFTISAGTAFGTAVGIIASVVASGGVSVSTTIISSLFSGITGAVSGSIIDSIVNGTFQCREYRWDYRIRLNSNTGTIKKTVYKCRYWWEMYNNNGIRAFEYRNNLRNGWLLSNSELIAVALGRA